VTRESPIFESHAIAVMTTLRELGQSWAELGDLGVPAHDLGLVVGDAWLEPSSAQSDALTLSRAAEASADAGVEGMLRRAARFEAVSLVGDAAPLFASHGYPTELLRSPGGGVERSSVFDGILPARSGMALSAAIAQGGASIWARTRAPQIAAQAVALLLRRSAQRVCTFTRPSDTPDASG
jgi:hypothetical protein